MSHLILIGFKHAGKSVIGQALANALNLPYLDTDREIERIHGGKTGEVLSCRQIAEKLGLDSFRDLESEALRSALGHAESHVIATGGGTPIRNDNQDLIKRHKVIYVEAPKGHVYERILSDGRPAFCPPDSEPLLALQKIWEEREPVYQSLAHVRIVNDGTIDKAVEHIIEAVSVPTI